MYQESHIIKFVVAAIAGLFFENNFVMLKGPNKNNQSKKKLKLNLIKMLKQMISLIKVGYIKYLQDLDLGAFHELWNTIKGKRGELDLKQEAVLSWPNL